MDLQRCFSFYYLGRVVAAARQQPYNSNRKVIGKNVGAFANRYGEFRSLIPAGTDPPATELLAKLALKRNVS